MSEAPACHVERLRLFEFRNYRDQTVELGPGLNLITGHNAQGKTNLLEAVATLALTRSPRAVSNAELIRWEQPQCRIDATVRVPSGPMEVDVRFRRGGNGAAQRTITVDGRDRAAREMLGLCPVVMFWPEDLLLVKGGPEGRRRLLDIVLSQLDRRIAAELVLYRRALEQRNALLRQMRLGTSSGATLPGFDEAVARHGGQVRAARVRLVRALGPLAADALHELSDGRELLSLRYAGGTPDEDGAVDESAQAATLAVELEGRRSEELARGVTVAGPHRDDLELLLDGHAARTGASQGQQRSIVLACKLAEVRQVVAVAGLAPVLILDDVLSELDTDRRQRLLDALGAGRASQALITTSEPDVLAGTVGAAAARRLVVQQGTVETQHNDGHPTTPR